MRLDKFLKVSRLIKRRTVANEACDAGRVTVNGKPAKASTKVKKGDVIEIQFGTKAVKAEVLDIQDTTEEGRGKRAFPLYLIQKRNKGGRGFIVYLRSTLEEADRLTTKERLREDDDEQQYDERYRRGTGPESTQTGCQ